MAVVAVARPPTGINRQLGQVGEPVSDQVCVHSGGGAAHQSAKRVEIGWRRSLGGQICVEEGMMSDLIIGVVMDVVSHFILNNLQGLSIVRIATAAWDFVVLDAAEFVVLDPKVGLEYFCRRCEPEKGCVSRRETTTCFCGSDAAQQSRADGSCSDGERFAEERTTTD